MSGVKTRANMNLEKINMEWFLGPMREQERQYRKNITSSESSGVGYVFDESALAASSDTTKEWIETTVAAGTGIIFRGDVGGPSVMPVYGSQFERVWKDVSELVPGFADGDVAPSLYAYFLACVGEIYNHEFPMTFVTGNTKFLKIIEEEGSREELHNAVRARTALPGVNNYMFIDNEGQIKRANLKWNDAARPSDRRLSEWFREEYPSL